MTDRISIKKTEGWLKGRPSFLLAAVLLASCGGLEHRRVIEYQGPIREADTIEMLYAEEDALKVKMKAGKVREFQNGDREFPDGIFIEFFDSLRLTTVLSANRAYYFKSTNKWRAQGKVELKSMLQDEQLNTEELYWFPGTKKVSTDKFVTIRTGKEVIFGTGLDATQDLSAYQIRRVEGEFEVEEQP
ncbi:MAG: LPS export ABC transporter periplasmic protein LptC [Bacteroidota bacterium]